MSMDMKLAMSIPTITLIAIPIATGLARNMLIRIATSMITTTTTATSMIFIRITTMITTMSIMPIRIRSLPMAMSTAMARITTTMA